MKFSGGASGLCGALRTCGALRRCESISRSKSDGAPLGNFILPDAEGLIPRTHGIPAPIPMPRTG